MEVIEIFTMILILLAVNFLLFCAVCYKRCPSNKILVIYGKIGSKGPTRCIHRSGAFVFPFIQDYDYLSLTPMISVIDYGYTFENEGCEVKLSIEYAYAISSDENLVQNAAKRLLHTYKKIIMSMVEDIITGSIDSKIRINGFDNFKNNEARVIEEANKNVSKQLELLGMEILYSSIHNIEYNRKNQ